MIVVLLGKAGAGKTTVAKAMEKYVKDSFVIDGDELRAETANMDIAFKGREANMHLGFSRARRLSDLGFTVFVSMQAPIREIREQYLTKYDKQIVVHNLGDNPKDAKGYNDNFHPDYTGVDFDIRLDLFDVVDFYKRVFPKVLVPARFQGFHKGHKVVLEEAKRISPNVTVGLRVDDGDVVGLAENIALLESKGYNTIITPNIDDDWTQFANGYDVYVQGNPMVIEKFTDSDCEHYHVPRYGDVSGTNIRQAIELGEDTSSQVDEDVLQVLRSAIC